MVFIRRWPFTQVWLYMCIHEYLHWFMTLVLTTSTGEVVHAVQKPAIMEDVTCRGIPSLISPAFSIKCFEWSYAGIYKEHRIIMTKYKLLPYWHQKWSTFATTRTVAGLEVWPGSILLDSHLDDIDTMGSSKMVSGQIN